MPFPINTVHRLALEDGTSLLLLEDNTSKLVLDEATALDDPLNAATVTTLTPGLTFVGENIAGNNLTYEIEVDTVNTFDSTAGTGPTIIDSYSETNFSASSTVDGPNIAGAGQSFTGNGNPVGSAKFYADKSGSPTGNALAKIYAHSGVYGTSSVPTGAALATSDNFNVALLPASGSPALQTLTFSGANQITLTNGTKYVVTIEYNSGIGSTGIGLKADNTSPTHAGNSSFLNPTWSAVSSFDNIFYVYDNIITTASPLLDKTSDLNTGFTDDATLNADDKLLLETGNSGGSLLLEDNSSHLIINYSYPQSDYITYTVPSSTLSNSTTYYWRARQKIQNGGSYPATWSEIRSFTINTGGVTALGSTLLMLGVG